MKVELKDQIKTAIRVSLKIRPHQNTDPALEPIYTSASLPSGNLPKAKQRTAKLWPTGVRFDCSERLTSVDILPAG